MYETNGGPRELAGAGEAGAWRGTCEGAERTAGAGAWRGAKLAAGAVRSCGGIYGRGEGTEGE
jgi:hypothetical protein